MNKYNLVSRIFHWTMAIAIIGTLALGLYMADLEFTPEVGELYGYHKATGVLILLAFFLRIIWVYKHKAPPFPSSMKECEKKLATAAHRLLYFFMFLMPMSGWAMSSSGGYPVSVFGLFTLPSIVPKNKELFDILHEVHEYAGFALIALLVIHVAAVIYHQFVRKDNVLGRMTGRN